ncbi:MAG: class I SAM-dependent methyltransferase [Richelia sp. RM2_1_2]|nr:class I SAM-dependent methyltransferase [Richelia sp. RM2_1_2]
MKQLEDSQLETFDTEYVNDKRWQIIKEQIERDFPEGDFTFLDVGGGNGLFADRLLSNYPKSRGTVLDNSELLLSKNKSNSRKI